MEALIKKRIEEAANKICCTDCPFESIRNCKECVEKENAIKTANFALQNQWISVEEALPEKIEDKNYSKYVLTRQEYYEHEYYVIARYNYGFNMWVSTNYFKPEFITHWMPIPKIGGEK